MVSVLVTDKMQVSGKSASAFRNMAVWEGGYNLCIEICRAADKHEDQSNVLIQQLKTAATQVPLCLSKGASYKLGKQYVKHLRGSFVATKQLMTLMLLCHDLNYLPSEKFLELNSKLNEFSSKLWKYIKYSERKIKQRQSK